MDEGLMLAAVEPVLHNNEPPPTVFEACAVKVTGKPAQTLTESTGVSAKVPMANRMLNESTFGQPLGCVTVTKYLLSAVGDTEGAAATLVNPPVPVHL